MQFLVPVSPEDLIGPNESAKPSPYYIQVQVEQPFIKPFNGNVSHGIFRMLIAYDAGVENINDLPDSHGINIQFNASDPIFSQLLDKHLAIQAKINLCINAAEHVNNALLRENTVILTEGASIVGELREKYNELMLKDFMGQKGMFTDYIKKHDDYKNLLTKEQRRDFDKFVLNRNIYTHGILMVKSSLSDFIYENGKYMLRPEADRYEFLIEYINKKTQEHNKALVNEQILNDYLEFAQMIDRTLRDFSVMFEAAFMARKSRTGNGS